MPTRRVASKLALALTALTASAVSASACSGKTTDVPLADAAAGDAGPSPGAPDCPSAKPGPSDGCSKEGLLCEYGDDWSPRCDVVLVCSGGRWASPIYWGGGGTKCPSQRPTLPPNPPECAATAAAVPTGQTCTSTSTCAYDDAVCTCGVQCPSYPIRPPDCKPDAGVTLTCCDTSKTTWGCFAGPAFCTAPRPRVGAACTSEGASCAIDEAVECGQTVMQCQKGVWDLANTTCPASSARVKKDIAYVDDAQAEALRAQLMSVRLASYKYKAGDDATHLGFLIEDMPEGSPAVLPSRDRVDLYGYTSMTVATLQRQQKELDALKADVARLAAENAALRKRR
jgi:Chaperone of endosialidase